MARRLFVGLAVVFGGLATPLVVAAQETAPLYLSRSEENGALRMRVGTIFDDIELTQALHSGLPMRILVEAELWKDGFFDSQRGKADWRASIVFDPLERSYFVTGGRAASADTIVNSLAAVGEALEELFDLPLTPLENGRYYYLGSVTIETLSLSDLEELQRWLRGETSPEVRDENERETAMGRGVRRLLVRVLGLPSRRFKIRSDRFEVRFGDPG